MYGSYLNSTNQHMRTESVATTSPMTMGLAALISAQCHSLKMTLADVACLDAWCRLEASERRLARLQLVD